MIVLFTLLMCAVALLVILGELCMSQQDVPSIMDSSASQVVTGVTGNTLIVDINKGYPGIGDAIAAAGDGDTILVHSGVYFERVTIDNPMTLKGVDTGGGMPVIDGLRTGDVVTVSGGGVWLEGFSVRNSKDDGSGILVSSGGNTITGNDVTGCHEGIMLDHASNNVVRGNHVHDNDDAGLYITNGSGALIAGNHANDNLYGIYMELSSDALIEDNNCSNNIDIEIYMEHIADCIVRGNTVTSERIKVKKIDGIGIRYGTNVTFAGNCVSRHYYGIKVYESSDCVVEDNVADGSGVNIRLDFGTHDTTLRNNTVRNGVDNVYLHSSAYNNIVENNTCYNGREGIYMLESAGNLVKDNDVYNNTIGIRLVSATGNTITGNYAHDNSENIDADGGNNAVYGNYDYAKRPTPAPSPSITPLPSSTPLPSPTATQRGGNRVLDFIMSIIRAIFH